MVIATLSVALFLSLAALAYLWWCFLSVCKSCDSLYESCGSFQAIIAEYKADQDELLRINQGLIDQCEKRGKILELIDGTEL